MDDTRISKLISLVLRHKPEELNLNMDSHGWVSTAELVNAINNKTRFTMSDLERIVAQDNKQRYSFNDDKSCIRANQGHSIKVDVDLKETVPPDVLYHGTATRFTPSINKEGLIPKSRLYVHLSKDIETATNVGKRHGEVYIYTIDTKHMYEDGCKFYLSENGVWLTDKVHPKYFIR